MIVLLQYGVTRLFPVLTVKLKTLCSFIRGSKDKFHDSRNMSRSLWSSSLLAAPPTHGPTAVAISNTGYFVNNNISLSLLQEKEYLQIKKMVLHNKAQLIGR